MENKEMNTEKIKFYKKHPVLLAWLISIFIGLGYALFTIIASVIHYEQRDYVWEIIKAFTEMFTWAILMGAVLGQFSSRILHPHSTDTRYQLLSPECLQALHQSC